MVLNVKSVPEHFKLTHRKHSLDCMSVHLIQPCLKHLRNSSLHYIALLRHSESPSRSQQRSMLFVKMRYFCYVYLILQNLWSIENNWEPCLLIVQNGKWNQGSETQSCSTVAEAENTNAFTSPSLQTVQLSSCPQQIPRNHCDICYGNEHKSISARSKHTGKVAAGGGRLGVTYHTN